MFIAIYIDDLPLFSTNIDPWIDNVMSNLWNRFWITDLGNVSPYLNIEVDVKLSKKSIVNLL